MLEKMTDEVNIHQVIEHFESMTKVAGRVQKETLKKILEENWSTEYLQNLGLDGRIDPENFKECVPLVSHKDLEHYIQRVANGDSSSILTRKPIKTMSLSSGTTQGRPKFLPFNDELVDNTMQIYQTSFAFRNREYPITGGKALQFIYSSKQFKTKGGLDAGTATTNVFCSSKYKTTMKSMQSQCCSPDEVIFSPDFHQSLYCHLLCGLLFSYDVQFVSSTFAYSIVHAFRTFEQVWEQLCNDIRDGVLSSRITIPSIREAMSKLLKPDPKLANLMYKKCSRLTNWYGLIPKLFPNAKYVYGIMTGSMLPYLKKLRHYAGDLPLLSADYGSSEGWIGVNVNPQLPPELATFAVLPNVGYFEFIPLGKNAGVADKNNGDFLSMEPKPVGLTEVKIGEEYEVIITNFAGLYRYRLGDVVKVMGFCNATPELQFIRRKNLMLNISIDKNTEKDVELAVETAAKLLAEGNLEVIDFTSHADVSKEPGHYVIFWEINGEASYEVTKECCNCMDCSFIDAGYVEARKTNSIGPLELRVLRRGTFQKVLNHYLGLGAAVSQFKTPRCVEATNKKLLQILHDNSVECYFSTAF